MATRKALQNKLCILSSGTGAGKVKVAYVLDIYNLIAVKLKELLTFFQKFCIHNHHPLDLDSSPTE